jgi:hypothetical protein
MSSLTLVAFVHWSRTVSPKQFLSRAEFVQTTGLSMSSVDRRLRSKQIPCVRSGRRVLMPMAFVEAMKAEAVEQAKPVIMMEAKS